MMAACVLMCLLLCMVTVQLVKLAKRLRKEKVNVDVVNFGEEVGLVVFYNVCKSVLLSSRLAISHREVWAECRS